VGSIASALAIATRWLCPPDSSSGRARTLSARPTLASSRSACAIAAARGMRFTCTGASVTFWRTVMCRNRLNCWSDALAFNRWRVTSDHRPLGEIMNVRRIYRASAKARRTLNHQPQTEPTSADEVLA
jgi:hypothetical protein